MGSKRHQTGADERTSGNDHSPSLSRQSKITLFNPSRGPVQFVANDGVAVVSIPPKQTMTLAPSRISSDLRTKIGAGLVEVREGRELMHGVTS